VAKTARLRYLFNGIENGLRLRDTNRSQPEAFSQRATSGVRGALHAPVAETGDMAPGSPEPGSSDMREAQ
jgi:hypothetical protein